MWIFIWIPMHPREQVILPLMFIIPVLIAIWLKCLLEQFIVIITKQLFLWLCFPTYNDFIFIFIQTSLMTICLIKLIWFISILDKHKSHYNYMIFCLPSSSVYFCNGYVLLTCSLALQILFFLLLFRIHVLHDYITI